MVATGWLKKHPEFIENMINNMKLGNAKSVSEFWENFEAIQEVGGKDKIIECIDALMKGFSNVNTGNEIFNFIRFFNLIFAKAIEIKSDGKYSCITSKHVDDISRLKDKVKGTDLEVMWNSIKSTCDCIDDTKCSCDG